jgi:hypothetical protein
VGVGGGAAADVPLDLLEQALLTFEVRPLPLEVLADPLFEVHIVWHWQVRCAAEN